MGPMSQFCSSERARTAPVAEDLGEFLVADFCQRRNIITMRPMAMGMLVVPLWKRLTKTETCGTSVPGQRRRHGEKDPEREEAIQKREMLSAAAERSFGPGCAAREAWLTGLQGAGDGCGLGCAL